MDIDKNYEKAKAEFITNDKLSPKLNAIYEQFIEASSLSNQLYETYYLRCKSIYE